MDYGKMINKAWNIIWEHKFLILLGVFVVIGQAGGGGSGSFSSIGNQPNGQDLPSFEFQNPFQDFGMPVFAAGGVVILVLIALIIGIAIWALAVIAEGGIISSADRIASGGESNFGSAFQAGWKKGWRLAGINLIPALPVIALLLTGLAIFGFVGGVTTIAGDQVISQPRTNAFLPVIAVSCLLIPLALVLSLLSTFANRACMLENSGVFSSYRRGFQVLTAHLGEAIVLFLLQIAISIALGIILLLPGFLSLLCCFLWPVLLLVQGTFAAFYTTLWTLAWNEWTVGESASSAAN